MDVERAVDARFSCREFANKKVRWDKVLEAIDAANKAPFAGNINHLKFIVVQDQETKNDIATHAQQYWIADAPIVVVVCGDDTKLERMYHERGKRYAKQQAGAAIENFLLRIVELGFASCWVGAFADELIKQALHIPEHIHVEAILPIGKPKRKAKPTKKLGLDNVTYWGKWGVSKKPTGYEQ